MSLNEPKKIKLNTRTIVLIAIMAATIEVAKLSLAILPNIEVVTLLCAIYGYVFGWYGVIAAAVFVCIEPLIYGIDTWVVTYFIYWPLVSIVFFALSKLGVKKRLPLTAVALALTLFFGLLSSLVDCLAFGIGIHYLKNVVLMYIRGISFYINQLVCNGVVFPLLFIPLSKKLREIGIPFLKS